MTASSRAQRIKADVRIESSDSDTQFESRPQGYYYLSPRALEQLPNYEFNAEDHSIIFRYVLSPFAGFLVNRLTPRWLAPNVITLLGLSWMITSYVLLWFYCPNLSEGVDKPEAVPNWIFVFNFIAMLAYQTLDNMDGKQARRTASSSPLGLLFDHGCDAINTVPGAINWAIAVGLGPSSDPAYAWFVIFAPMALFYITTWEEFFTGKMVLPIVNGPSEGIIAGALFSLTSSVWEVAYWRSETWYERIVQLLPESAMSWTCGVRLRNVDLIVAVSVIWLIQEIGLKILQLTRRFGTAALKNLTPFFFLIGATSYIGAKDPEIFMRSPRSGLHLVSALFVEMTTQLMLDHVCGEKFNPYRPALVPLFVLLVYVHTDAPSAIKVDEFILVHMIGTWVFVFFKIRVVIDEICNLLKIWCFDIVTPHPGDQIIAGESSASKKRN